VGWRGEALAEVWRGEGVGGGLEGLVWSPPSIKSRERARKGGGLNDTINAQRGPPYQHYGPNRDEVRILSRLKRWDLGVPTARSQPS
jgi:hypothetical protein